MTRDIIIDLSNPDKNGVIKSPILLGGTTLAPFVLADGEYLRIFPVRPTGDSQRPWDSVDISANSISASIGIPGAKPTGGTFGLGYGASSTTSALSISPSALSASLNAFAEIIADGGVTVSGVAGDYYLVEWDSVGARATSFSTVSKNLTPFGQVTISQVQVGDASTKEIRLIRLVSQLLATTSDFSQIPDIAGEVSVVAAGDGSSHPIQIFKFSRQPTGGTFVITIGAVVTNSLQWDASAQDIEDALGADWSVSGPNGGPWTIEKLANEALSAGTMDTDGIFGLDGWEALLRISTKEMFLSLAAETSDELDAVFEVELVDGDGIPFTILQSDIQINKEVMASGILATLFSELGVPLGAGAVLYSLVQALTQAQVSVALANLDIETYPDLATANATEGAINVAWYNSSTRKIQMTTSAS